LVDRSTAVSADEFQQWIFFSFSGITFNSNLIAGTEATSPSSSERITWPESRAAFLPYQFQQLAREARYRTQPDVACSNPSKRGWRHRVPRNGIKDVVTEIICFGETSIQSISSVSAIVGTP
jgi:hypothetical protein